MLCHIPAGSRDETVRLWDVRMPDQAGGLVTKHHQMVTSMDTNEHLLTTASLDNNVFVFDLRMLGQAAQVNPVSAASWMNGGVLKVAIAGEEIEILCTGCKNPRLKEEWLWRPTIAATSSNFNTASAFTIRTTVKYLWCVISAMRIRA